MSDREINTIVSKSLIRHLEPGEVLIQQGAACDFMYTLVVGDLEVIMTYGDGEHRIDYTVKELHCGMSCGEESMSGLSARHTIRASKACELGAVRSLDSKMVLSQSADLRAALTKMLEEPPPPILDLIAEARPRPPRRLTPAPSLLF